MNNMETIIKELEDAITEATYTDRPRKFMMSLELAEKVLVLLKEQQPRVMTAEELLAIGNVWEYNTPPYLWMDVNPNIRFTDGFWVAWRDIRDMIHGLHPKYTDQNYGTDWRCWVSKPTNEQRQSEKWN